MLTIGNFKIGRRAMERCVVFTVFLVLAIFSVPAVPQPASSEDVTIEYLGSTLWSRMNDATVVGDHAFCAMFFGLLVLDVSDPTTPTVVSRMYLPEGDDYVLAVSGKHAFLAGNSHGRIEVIDISNPKQPSRAGTLISPGIHFRDVVAAGNILYLAAGRDGLLTVDASEPSSPRLVSDYNTPGSAAEVSLVGDQCYVVVSDSGIQIVDVSDPKAPISSGRIITPSRTMSVAATHRSCYVACKDSCLRVYEIKDIVDTVLLAKYSLKRPISLVTLQGSQLLCIVGYVGQEDLCILDASVPSELELVNVIRKPVQGCIKAVSLSDQNAYIVYGCGHDSLGDGLQIVDISNPQSPKLRGSHKGSQIWDVAISGQHAYVAGVRNSLYVIDFLEPTMPYLVGSCDIGDHAYSVAVSGNTVCLADQRSGLQLIDVRDPAAPQPFGSIKLLGGVSEVVAIGDLVCVTSGHKLCVIDPTKPAELAERECRSVPGIPLGLAAVGRHSCVITSDSGLFVLDVTVPGAKTSPLIRTGIGAELSYGTITASRSVTAAGRYAYITDVQSNFLVVSLESLRSSEIVGRCKLRAARGPMQVAGEHVVIAGREMLQVIDVSEPESPRLVASHEMPSAGMDLAISGRYCLIAGNYGLLVFQIHGID